MQIQLEKIVTLASNGATIEEIRKRIRILDALESAKDGVLLVEDADWDLLRTLFNSFRFGAAQRGLLDIADEINNATSKDNDEATV